MIILGAVIIFVSIVMTGIYVGNAILVCMFIDDYKSKQEVRRAFLIPFYKGWIELIDSVRKMPDK